MYSIIYIQDTPNSIETQVNLATADAGVTLSPEQPQLPVWHPKQLYSNIKMKFLLQVIYEIKF